MMTLIWFLVPTAMGVTLLVWGIREIWRERKRKKRIRDYLDYFFDFSFTPSTSEGVHIVVGVTLIMMGVISLFMTS